MHLFLLESERLDMCDIERGVLFKPLGVGLQNVFLHTTKSLIHALGCDVLLVYCQSIKYIVYKPRRWVSGVLIVY